MYRPDDATKWQWRPGEGVVCFQIRQDNRVTTCRVSQEYIEDHCGGSEHGNDSLAAAKAHFDQITDLALFKLHRREFEPDGSILIRSIG
jgi:hypothetical protein